MANYWEGEPRCECGCIAQHHDCLSEAGECLNTRCPEDCTRYRPVQPVGATKAAEATFYTSEPIPGRQNPFCTSDGRYWADAELARRAQKDLDELAALEVDGTAAGEAAAVRSHLTLLQGGASAGTPARVHAPRPAARLRVVLGGQR